MQNFINELSNYLENKPENNASFVDEGVPIIEDILSKNNVTTGNENSIRWKEEDTIIKYAEKTCNNEPMYFVKDNKKAYWSNNERHFNNTVYRVLKVQNSQIEEMEIDKSDMPKDIKVNDVFRIKNGQYIIDNFATKELQEAIIAMATEIIDKQNVNLDKNRKEGHLYMVTQDSGNNIFLCDLTEASKTEFEEVNFQKDLLNKLAEGVVLRYTHGRYEYYSDDGFERI